MNNTISIAPVFPLYVIIGLAILASGVLFLSGLSSIKTAFFKSLPLACLLIILLNPIFLEENREYLPDIALVIIDKSRSMELENRKEITRQVQNSLKSFSDQDTSLTLREVILNGDSNMGEEGTYLVTALKNELAKVPKERLAGIILLTDGQIHDSEQQIKSLSPSTPVHSIIIGSPKREDRRIEVISAPRYGIIGEMASFTFRVDDSVSKESSTHVTISVNGKIQGTFPIKIGEKETLSFKIPYRGKHIVELSVPTLQNELTNLNNQYSFEIDGIRDRLRVLLITGEPYSGAREWRNLLKSDPSIDLIHFTILRTVNQNTLVSEDETALIPFPTHELFDRHLKTFDLIIFDRYRLRGALSPYYLDNIVHYVENGGGVLVTAGPPFAGPFSLYRSPLASILPASPTGKILNTPYKPLYTDIGGKHPITLPVAKDHDHPDWGRWFRILEAHKFSGHTLLKDQDNHPLLIVDRIEKGRIALLLSDQAWLWAKGIDGGGPYTELFRRLAHWLMKEPELEEDKLTAKLDKGELVLTRTLLDKEPENARVFPPDQTPRKLVWKKYPDGHYEARTPADQIGLWKAFSDNSSALLSVGVPNPKEFETPLATQTKLEPLSRKTQGAIYSILPNFENRKVEPSLPQWKRVHKNERTAQGGTIGLKENKHYKVSNRRTRPLAPILIIMLLSLLLIALAWFYEK